MKALVVLENHFYVDEDDNVWCDRIVDYGYLKRYLQVFDKIVVAGRAKKESKKLCANKLRVLGENVEFVSLPDFVGARGILKNRKRIKNILKTVINDVDCVIYRAPTHLSIFTYKEVLKQNTILIFEFMMAADKMFDGNSIVSKIFNKVIDYAVKKMILKANGVSYVTDYTLQKKYPSRFIKYDDNKCIYGNYSSIDLTKELFYEQKWNRDIVPSRFKIIHTGYMDSYRKGQDILIKALKIVVDKGYDNVVLEFIGDGVKKNEFMSLAKRLDLEDKIIFKGLVSSKKEIIDELKSSNLFVFPTTSEGLPRSLIEAMAVGLPCISSPVDGIPELIDSDYLVAQDDVEGYANLIIYFIENWGECIEIGRKNYLKSLNYEKSIIDKKRNDFYLKIKERVEDNEKK